MTCLTNKLGYWCTSWEAVFNLVCTAGGIIKEAGVLRFCSSAKYRYTPKKAKGNTLPLDVREQQASFTGQLSKGQLWLHSLAMIQTMSKISKSLSSRRLVGQ